MDYYHIIRYALKTRNIKVERWVEEDGGGWAYITDRKVIIPRPTSIVGFARCWHEIGHFDLNHTNKKRRYIEEYEAETFAIDKLKHYGVDTKSYTRIAKRYVMHQLQNSFKRGHTIDKVPVEIIKWYGKNFNQYKKKVENLIFAYEKR